jgi:hypothetical protein
MALSRRLVFPGHDAVLNINGLVGHDLAQGEVLVQDASGGPRLIVPLPTLIHKKLTYALRSTYDRLHRIPVYLSNPRSVRQIRLRAILSQMVPHKLIGPDSPKIDCDYLYNHAIHEETPSLVDMTFLLRNETAPRCHHA